MHKDLDEAVRQTANASEIPFTEKMENLSNKLYSKDKKPAKPGRLFRSKG